MSKIPDTEKPKYNNNDPFRWVDSQWEKFMTEQMELKKVITQLRDDLVTCNKHFQKQRDDILQVEMENAELKDMVLDLGGEYKESSDERTDEWRIKQFNRNRAPEEQVHSIQEMNDRVEDLFSDKWIYESPDGKKIYRRKSGSPHDTRELTKE